MGRIIDFILHGLSFYICIIILACLFGLGWLLSGTMLVIILCCLVCAFLYGLYEKIINNKRRK